MQQKMALFKRYDAYVQVGIVLCEVSVWLTLLAHNVLSVMSRGEVRVQFGVLSHGAFVRDESDWNLCS